MVVAGYLQFVQYFLTIPHVLNYFYFYFEVLIAYVTARKCYFLELVLFKLSSSSESPGVFVKIQIVQDHTRISDSVSLEWGPKNSFSEFPQGGENTLTRFNIVPKFILDSPLFGLGCDMLVSGEIN